MIDPKNYWCLLVKELGWIPLFDRVRAVVRQEGGKIVKKFDAHEMDRAWAHCQKMAKCHGGTAYHQNIAGRIQESTCYAKVEPGARED